MLWISGDTLLYDGVRSVADHLEVSLAVPHLGDARFRVAGPVRSTMTAEDGVELCRSVRLRAVVPVHYDAWSHFREGARCDRGGAGRCPRRARHVPRPPDRSRRALHHLRSVSVRAITQFDNPSRIRFVVLRLPNHGTRGSARTFILSEAGVGIVHVVIGTALAIRFVGFGHRLRARHTSRARRSSRYPVASAGTTCSTRPVTVASDIASS